MTTVYRVRFLGIQPATLVKETDKTYHVSIDGGVTVQRWPKEDFSAFRTWHAARMEIVARLTSEATQAERALKQANNRRNHWMRMKDPTL